VKGGTTKPQSNRGHRPRDHRVVDLSREPFGARSLGGELVTPDQRAPGAAGVSKFTASSWHAEARKSVGRLGAAGGGPQALGRGGAAQRIGAHHGRGGLPGVRSAVTSSSITSVSSGGLRSTASSSSSRTIRASRGKLLGGGLRAGELDFDNLRGAESAREGWPSPKVSAPSAIPCRGKVGRARTGRGSRSRHAQGQPPFERRNIPCTHVGR